MERHQKSSVDIAIQLELKKTIDSTPDISSTERWINNTLFIKHHCPLPKVNHLEFTNKTLSEMFVA